jgi:hypothetical protein
VVQESEIARVTVSPDTVVDPPGPVTCTADCTPVSYPSRIWTKNGILLQVPCDSNSVDHVELWATAPCRSLMCSLIVS